MKSYHTLALKEILEQKVISVLILIAVILSTMMTAAVGQSAGILSAMRIQQAVAIGGDRHATFLQLTEEKAQILEQDPRVSYAGRVIPIGGRELNDLLRLELSEYQGNSIETIPSYYKAVGGKAAGGADGDCPAAGCSAVPGIPGKDRRHNLPASV